MKKRGFQAGFKDCFEAFLRTRRDRRLQISPGVEYIQEVPTLGLWKTNYGNITCNDISAVHPLEIYNVYQQVTS